MLTCIYILASIPTLGYHDSNSWFKLPENSNTHGTSWLAPLNCPFRNIYSSSFIAESFWAMLMTMVWDSESLNHTVFLLSFLAFFFFLISLSFILFVGTIQFKLQVLNRLPSGMTWTAVQCLKILPCYLFPSHIHTL